MFAGVDHSKTFSRRKISRFPNFCLDLLVHTQASLDVVAGSDVAFSQRYGGEVRYHLFQTCLTVSLWTPNSRPTIAAFVKGLFTILCMAVCRPNAFKIFGRPGCGRLLMLFSAACRLIQFDTVFV